MYAVPTLVPPSIPIIILGISHAPQYSNPILSCQRKWKRNFFDRIQGMAGAEY